MKKLAILLLVLCPVICATAFSATRPDDAQIKNKPLFGVAEFQAKGDGTTDDSTAFSNALSSGSIQLRSGLTYRLSSSLSIPSNRLVDGNGATILLDPTKQILSSGTSNITIRNVIVTASDSAFVAASRGTIEIANAEGVALQNITVNRPPSCGFLLRDVSSATVTLCSVHNFGYMGVLLSPGTYAEGCSYVNITYNTIASAGDTSINAYGIAIGGDSTSYDAGHSDINVSRNTVVGIPQYTGLDVHGGSRIVFSNNLVANVRRGIEAVIGYTNNKTPSLDYVKISDNIFVGPSSDAGVQPEYGIGIGGSFDAAGGNIYTATYFDVSGNIVRGFNKLYTGGAFGGIYVTNCQYFSINGNILYDNYLNGISLVLQNATSTVSYGSISNNLINGGGVASWGVNLYSNYAGQYNNLDISHNTITNCDYPAYAVAVSSNSSFLFNSTAGCSTSRPDGTTSNLGRYKSYSGWVTENFGETGSIASGTDVAHGLTATPSSVIVTPKSGLASGTYISDITDTTFRVNYDESTNRNFSWSAKQ